MDTESPSDILIPDTTNIQFGVPLPVEITHFLTPTKFWVRLTDDSAPSAALPSLHVKNASHYYFADVGMHCIAVLGSGIGAVRACVLDVQTDGTGLDVAAEVYCVDYGFTTVVGMDKLFPISREQAEAPCRAIPCSLRRLTSTAKGIRNGWRPSVGVKFEAVFNSVSAINTYYVELYTVYNTRDGTLKVPVSEDLIRKGEAEVITYPFKPEAKPSGQQTYGVNERKPPEVPPACTPRGAKLTISITYILTPQHWYGHCLPMAKEAKDIDTLLINYEDTPAKPCEVTQGSFWVLREPNKPRGFRVCVVRPQNLEQNEVQNEGRVQVFLVDYGNKKTVATSSLYWMKPAVAQYPAMATRYCLDSLQPIGDQWTKEALNVFEEVACVDEPVTAHIVEKIHRSTVIISVKLWNKNVGVEIGKLLVDRGFARLQNTAVRKCLRGGLERRIRGPRDVNTDPWEGEPMDYEDVWIEYDLGPSAVPAAEDSCHCTNRAVRMSSPPLLEMPKHGEKVLVQVSAVCDPGNFYVIFPYGTRCMDDMVKAVSSEESHPNLCTLQNKLSSHYDGSATDSLQSYFREQLVAAFEKKSKLWYRAKVVSIRGGTLQVFSVDFGFTGRVGLSDVRTLAPEFLKFPFQAVHCRLDDVEPTGRELGQWWSKESHLAFLEYVAKKDLLCEVVKAFSESLQVKLFFLCHNHLQCVGGNLIRTCHAQPRVGPTRNKPLPA